mgnify:CR=1 FL=1
MQTKNPISRRQFIGGAAAFTATALLPGSVLGSSMLRSSHAAMAKFKGVNIGVITYSFRSMPGSADELLHYLCFAAAAMLRFHHTSRAVGNSPLIQVIPAKLLNYSLLLDKLFR